MCTHTFDQPIRGRTRATKEKRVDKRWALLLWWYAKSVEDQGERLPSWGSPWKRHLSCHLHNFVVAISQVDDSCVVIEKLTPISRYLFGNTVGIFDILLTELLQYAAETVIPPLLFLGRLARVCRSELDKQLITCVNI